MPVSCCEQVSYRDTSPWYTFRCDVLRDGVKTKTELKIDYVLLSWNHEFPEHIEVALENDYVEHPHLYDADVLKRVAALLLIAPDASSRCVLSAVRRACVK